MTHKEPFRGLPQTSKKVSFTGIDIFRLVEGKVMEHWDEVDRLGFLRQLGLVKLPVHPNIADSELLLNSRAASKSATRPRMIRIGLKLRMYPPMRTRVSANFRMT